MKKLWLDLLYFVVVASKIIKITSDHWKKSSISLIMKKHIPTNGMKS